jgi:hypothetical protein
MQGIFGNVKNDASENSTRSRFRVMGSARVSLMTLITVMAADLRLTRTFRARQGQEASDAVRHGPPATNGSPACTPVCARRWVSPYRSGTAWCPHPTPAQR